MRVTFSAPSLYASQATSQPTFPAPMITTSLPTGGGESLLALFKKLSAGITFSLPGKGILRGSWVPTAMTT